MKWLNVFMKVMSPNSELHEILITGGERERERERENIYSQYCCIK